MLEKIEVFYEPLRNPRRFKEGKMAQYAIAFDLDTTAMKDDGITDSQRAMIYQVEIPKALALCGFTGHPQGSLYHTESEQDPITAVMTLLSKMQANATNFCKYVRRAHVFRMEEWSDVTALFTGIPAATSPTPQEEMEEQDLSNSPIQ
jgi:virulence-associated protein VapD